MIGYEAAYTDILGSGELESARRELNNPGWAVNKGSCDSPAINDFAEIHELLRQTVRDYVWTLDNMVESLTNAGNALYNMDEKVGNGISKD